MAELKEKLFSEFAPVSTEAECPDNRPYPELIKM